MKTLLATALITFPGMILFWGDRLDADRSPASMGLLLVLMVLGLCIDLAALLPAAAALCGTAAALTPDSSLQAAGSFACLVLACTSVALFIHREAL